MADLEFTGGVDFSEALTEVDQLGDAIRSRLDEALGNVNVESFIDTLSAAASDALSTPIAVEADASAIVPEVEAAIADAGAGAQVDIAVAADTAPAEGAVDELVSAVESTSTEIVVGADTSEAQTSIDDLGDASSEAQDSLSGTAAATTALGTAGTLTGGSVDALSGGVANLATRAGGAGVAIGAGVALLGGFTAAAINSLGATQRLESTMGDLAERIETIQVGNLNVDLGELAIQTGSSGSGMRNAAVDAFTLGTSFGKGRGETADFSAEILALAGRAVSLNPKLGETGEVANGLVRALASGREKALLPFALGISAVEINQRAATVALADGRETVTAADKAFAGAALAVEKLGGRLKQDIEEGSKNPILAARSLAKEFSAATTEIGKPLASPALDALRAALPVTKSIAESIGDLAGVGLPLLASGLGLVGPLVGPVVQGFIVFQLATKALPFTLNLLSGSLLTVAQSAAFAGTAVGVGATQAATASAAFVGVAGPLALIAGGAYIAGTSLGLFAEDIESAQEQAAGFTAELRKATDAGLVRRFSVDVGEASVRALAAGDSFNKATIGLETFRRIATEDVGVARRLLDALNDAGVNTGGYAAALDRAVQKQRAANQAESDSVTTKERLLGPTKEQTDAVDAYVQALDDEKRALDEIQNRLLGLPGAQLNQANAVRDQAQAQREYNDAVAQYGPFSNEAIDASLRLDGANQGLARTTLALQVAQDEFNKIVQDSPARIQAQIDKLREAQASGPEAAAALQPYVDQLQAIKDKADALSGTYSVDIQIAVATAFAPGSDLSAVAALGGGDAIAQQLYAFLESLGPPRAAGGPVEAGTPYPVGERGPELFVPEMSGTIYPQSFGGGGARTGGGGEGGFVMNGNVILEQASPNPVREVVRVSRVMRRGAAMAGL